MTNSNQVRYPVNGVEKIFTPEKTVVNLYVNDPEMSHVDARTGIDPGGYDAERVRIFRSADALMFFSGIAMPSEEVSERQAVEKADIIQERYGWDPQVNIIMDAPEEVRQRYNKITEQQLAKKAIQEAQREAELDLVVEEVASTLRFGYFPASWARSK